MWTCYTLGFVHPSCDLTLAMGFRRAVQRTGWIVSIEDVYYPDMGDTVADSRSFFVEIHKGATADPSPIRVTFPPSPHPNLLAKFVYTPFNMSQYCWS